MNINTAKQFCRRGHDIQTIGRKANGACCACKVISNRAWYVANREQARATMRKWNIDNRHKTRERNWAKAGIKDFTVEQYKKLLILQGRRCAVCGAHESMLDRPLVVDHDHKSGIVRGLLCDSDNKGLGHFQDSPERMNHAIRYLAQFTLNKGEVYEQNYSRCG